MTTASKPRVFLAGWATLMMEKRRPEELTMLIEAGFDVAFECPAATPMILQLSIHPSRDADLLTPDRIASDPPLPMRSYLDLFGNRVTPR